MQAILRAHVAQTPQAPREFRLAAVLPDCTMRSVQPQRPCSMLACTSSQYLPEASTADGCRLMVKVVPSWVAGTFSALYTCWPGRPPLSA